MKNSFITLLFTFPLLVPLTSPLAETVKMGTTPLPQAHTQIIIDAFNEALQEYDYSVQPEMTTSSQANIDNLISGQITIALSPLDIAAQHLKPEKDPNENLLLIGGKLVPKALFCVAYKGGNVVTYDDLTDKQETPLKISVGNQHGATARLFQSMMTLDPELKNIEFYHEEATMKEINRLLSGRRDLVCFIMMPDPENELIEAVMAHDELFFISINHPSFAMAKIGKLRIYDIMEVPVSSGFFGLRAKQVKTLVTWLSLVVNENKVDKKLLDALSLIVMKPDLLPSNSLSGKAKSLFKKAINSIEEVIN
jgi:TRAP-type uncharacterized transport system substrate-binding protein